MSIENVDKLEVLEGGVVPSEEPLKEDSKSVEATIESVAETPVESEKKRALRRPKRFPSWMDFFATIGVFVISVFVGSLVAVAMMKLQGYEAMPPHVTFVYYLIQMLPTIAFILWRRHKAGRDSGLHVGLRRLNMPMILWGVLLVVASGVVIEPILSMFPTEAYDNVMQTIGFGGWAILSTVVAAPVLEEVLFRGLIFESFGERFGRGAGLLISALLFGLIHGVPVQMVNAFVVGLILGYIYLRTRSLVSVIIIHAVNNAIAYATMAFFGDSGQMTLRELISQSWFYWTLYGISALLCLWAMIRLWRVLRDNTEVE